MKIRLATKSITSTLATIMVLSTFSLFGIVTQTTSAATATKTFEVGPGTGQATSHFRTFAVPCGQSVDVKVKFYRLGDPGAQNDVPLIIELRKPGASESQDGPIAATKNVTAYRTDDPNPTHRAITQNGVELNGSASDQSCSIPWRVRVRRADGAPQNAAKGEISLTYRSSSSSIGVEGSLISLNKGNTVTKDLGGSGGLKQGKIIITANWNHAVGPVPGPLPVLLKFELKDPTGLTVKTVTAYSSNQIGVSPQFRLEYIVPTCKPGQWKLKITNNTNDDTMNIDPKVTFIPECN